MRFFVLLLVVASLTITTILCDEEKFTKEHKNLLEKLTELYLNKDSPKQNEVTSPIDDSVLEKQKRINLGFEKMIQFIHVLGQVDDFVSDKTKNFVRRINAIYQADDKNS
ncbi:uncharacterized protein [Prorops nasuta]|uniref:uncharacterized protein n=1 Tax=Prorops nasuta TaxID=863751 RepID=UPI0034CFBEEB